jgi:hypothetical protein
MLKIDVDQITRIVIVEPEGHLSQQDFEALAKQVDPLIIAHGNLKGVIIHASSFPGWDSFAALVAHFQFAKGHHKQVSKVALCTDSLFGSLVEKLAEHFVAAEIKHFPYAELSQAKLWISQ